MDQLSIAFVGGGRVTALLLRALSGRGALPPDVVVSDPNSDGLSRVKEIAPDAISCT